MDTDTIMATTPDIRTKSGRALRPLASFGVPGVARLRPRRGAGLAVAGLMVLTGLAAPACQSKSAGGEDQTERPVPRIPSAEIPLARNAHRGLKAVRISSRGLKLSEGTPRAPIVIHKFGDFNCSHCFHASKLLSVALKRWPGKVQIFYRQFPLDGTCNGLVGRKGDGSSCLAAKTALCAAEQGVGPAVYHGIYALHSRNEPIVAKSIKRIVNSSRGDWSRIQRCLNSKQTRRALRRDVDAGSSIQLEATPTIVVNGRLLPPGTPNAIQFLQLLDALILKP